MDLAWRISVDSAFEGDREGVEWWLCQRTEFPLDPVTVAARQHFGAEALATGTQIAEFERHHQRVGNNDDERPALYGKGVDVQYSHSLGIQKGWIGR